MVRDKNSNELDQTSIDQFFYAFSKICVFMLLIFALLNIATQFHAAAAIDLLGVLFFMIGLWLRKKNYLVISSGIALVFTSCLVLFLQSIILEPSAYHNMFFYPAVGVFCFALFENKQHTIGCFVLTCVSAVASYLVPKYLGTTIWHLSDKEKDFYMVASLIGALAATYKIGATVYRQKEQAFESVSQANKKLEKVNEKNKKLLQLIVHDVSNPLISIDFAVKNMSQYETAEMALQKIDGICDPAIITIKEIIETAREMMALEDGKTEVRLSPVNLRKTVEETLVLLAPAAKKKAVKIETDFNLAESARVLADPKSLKSSVLANLFSNALKFSHRGSSIKFEAKEKESQIIMKVIDTGVGMSPSQLANLFSPSEKTTRPGTEGEPGTGYGMPLVKAFVQSYGGEIECVSEKGVGTLVKLTLKKAHMEERTKQV